MTMIAKWFALGALAWAPTVAAAQTDEYDSQRIVWQVGSWTVGSGAGGCLATLTYEGSGETRLSIAVNADDGNQRLLVTNANWSSSTGNTYGLHFAIDRGSYTVTAVGIEHGFGFLINDEILRRISGGNRVVFLRGDVVVDDLALDGSAAAIDKLKQCTQVLRNRVAIAKEAADRKARADANLNAIAKDPFAADDGPKQKPKE